MFDFIVSNLVDILFRAPMAHNVPTLGAVGDFGKLNCLPARIYNRSTKFQ
jgi:hypothetical protein